MLSGEKCISHIIKKPIFPSVNSGDLSVLQQEQTLRFRLSRFNRYLDYYDAGDGDWGWLTENIDEDREQVLKSVWGRSHGTD